MIRHLIFVKFKKGTSAADIANIEKGFQGLPSAIPEIKSFEYGRDVVRSERSYDFALVALFDDLAALDRYRVHPAHVAAATTMRASAESVLAVDFEL